MSGHTATPADEDRVSFPRWWIIQLRDNLMKATLPHGPLGDWAFLFREQLNDALNKPVVTACNSHADLVKALEEAREIIKPFAQYEASNVFRTVYENAPENLYVMRNSDEHNITQITVADFRAASEFIASAALATLTARKVG